MYIYAYGINFIEEALNHLHNCTFKNIVHLHYCHKKHQLTIKQIEAKSHE